MKQQFFTDKKGTRHVCKQVGTHHHFKTDAGVNVNKAILEAIQVVTGDRQIGIEDMKYSPMHDGRYLVYNVFAKNQIFFIRLFKEFKGLDVVTFEEALTKELNTYLEKGNCIEAIQAEELLVFYVCHKGIDSVCGTYYYIKW